MSENKTKQWVKTEKNKESGVGKVTEEGRRTHEERRKRKTGEMGKMWKEK